MVELRIINGKMAGRTMVIRHFPFYIGRSPDCDFQLLEDGVWDKHLKVELTNGKVIFRVVGPGQVQVNKEDLAEFEMKTGNLIKIGSVMMDSRMCTMEQHEYAWMEHLVWAGGAACIAVEVALFFSMGR